MSGLTVFQFESKEVRFVGTPVDPWWVAADICFVLEIKNPSQAIARLDEDDRAMLNIGIKVDVWCVNESGLYSLILGSRKPQAKRFKKWVTSEVLPSIRKTGSYAIAPTTPQPALPPTPQEISDIVDLLFTNSQIHENLKLQVKGKAIAKQHPNHAATIETMLGELLVPVEDELLTPTRLGQMLGGVSPRQVNQLLLDQNFQTKNPDGKNPAYLPTEKGKQYSQIILNTAHSHDKTVQTLRWFKSVLEALEVNDH